MPATVETDMFGDSGSLQPLPQRSLEHLVLEIGKDFALAGFAEQLVGFIANGIVDELNSIKRFF